MALDASIPLQVQNYSPMEGLGKAMTLSSLGMQLQQAKKQQDTERTLGDLYKMAYDPATGQIDNSKVLGGLANSGLGHQIPVYQKQLAEANKSTAELGKINAEVDAKKFETAKGQLNLLNGAIASLLSKPDMNHQDVITAVSGLVQAGVIPESQAVAAVRQLPGDPGRLRQFVVSIGMQGMEASKRMEMMTPKFERIDTGGSVMTGTVNPMTGQFTPGGAFEKTATPWEKMTDARMRDPSVIKHGFAGLNPEENESLFGVNGAVTQGRLDPRKVNSRTAKIFAQGEMLNPGRTDFTAISGDAALTMNPAFRQKAMVAETLPEIMKGMVDAGKKVNFSDVKIVGRMQAVLKGETNDPDMVNYMARRNDALMSIASVMRGNGMTDQAHKVEIEAASPTMSPKALESWLESQIASLQPRLDRYRKFTEHRGGGQQAPARPAEQSIPQTNSRGWQLHTDASGNRAYVSPDGSQYEEVR